MKCPICRGRGYVFVAVAPEDIDKDICDECDGTGEVTEQRFVELTGRK